MKKLLLIFIACLLLQAMQVFGQVDSRLVVISHTRGAIGDPGGSMLVLDLQLKSNYAYNIQDYKVTFNMGSGLNTIRSEEVRFDQTPLFPSSDYLVSQMRSGSNINLSYSYNGSTPVTLPTGSWTHVTDDTIIYTETSGATTSFSWGSYSVSFNLPPPISCTGYLEPIPDYLIDLSLPVQMLKMMAEYTYEDGAIIQWTTQSELNTEAFEVYRQDSRTNTFQLVSFELIPGQGTSSSATDYQMIDPTVSWNSQYQYYIKEISSDRQQVVAYYGPISLQTAKAPTKFVLYKNYPNPFNPSTMIIYEILEGGIIDISIYNLLGQKVATLVNEFKPAGIYPVMWSGVDDRGQNVPSGVYLYRITAPEGSEVRKMMKVE